MKYFIQFTLVVSVLFLLPKLNKASCTNQFEEEPKLIATKGEKITKYKTGTYISIVYGANFKKINGVLLAIQKDSILLQPNSKKQYTTSIAINDIQSAMKLHKKGRNGWIAITSILAALTIFGLILSKMKNFLALFALGIPAVSLFTFFPFLLGSFLADLLSKKSIKKGWVFSSKIF